MTKPQMSIKVLVRNAGVVLTSHSFPERSNCTFFWEGPPGTAISLLLVSELAHLRVDLGCLMFLQSQARCCIPLPPDNENEKAEDKSTSESRVSCGVGA